LKQGLIGERLAAEGLSQQGHKILLYKPHIKGTNQGGIDIVTMKDGQVFFIDNKAYTSGRNVAAVSALDKNFAQNVAKVRAEFTRYASDPDRTQSERDLYQQAVDAIDGKNYQKAVTTVAVAPDGQHSPGITPALASKEFVHIPIGPISAESVQQASAPHSGQATSNLQLLAAPQPGPSSGGGTAPKPVSSASQLATGSAQLIPPPTLHGSSGSTTGPSVGPSR
jgi:Holliday junction resolvase-like predicted endonuclease